MVFLFSACWILVFKFVWFPSQPEFPWGSMVKLLPAIQVTVYIAGDAGSIPESVRSPGEGNGNSLLQTRLGNPMDRGA